MEPPGLGGLYVTQSQLLKGNGVGGKLPSYLALLASIGGWLYGKMHPWGSFYVLISSL